MNINSGSYEKHELEEYMGKSMITAYTKDQDNPNKPLNEHWADIRHPQTGEKLYSQKAYCNPNNTRDTYYAEYRSESGRSYHYINEKALPSNVRSSDAKDINEQIYEDAQEYRKNRDNIQQQETKNDGIKRENNGITR